MSSSSSSFSKSDALNDEASTDSQTSGRSSEGVLPVESSSEAVVYNLTVLVRVNEKRPVTARAANLALPAVEAGTIREALSKLVTEAKSQIGRQLRMESEIPWIDPPSEPSELESRYVVPLHL